MNCCCAIFVKAPVKGFVKTRLAKSIGHDEAIKAYKMMAEKTISEVSSTNLDIKILFSPIEQKDLIKKWIPNYMIYPVQQSTYIQTIVFSYLHCRDKLYRSFLLLEMF